MAAVSTATATFMAVQCFQCSTMQVKQQKKSSNKWICVVCNEKQSVRKVFARSFMAKDVRKFVQSFNMSRKSADEEFPTDSDQQTLTEADRTPNSKRKPMTDWTAYLDLEDQVDAPAAAAEPDIHGPKVVTELPADMFKKTKLSRNSSFADTSDLRGKGVYKPSFSNRPTSIPVKQSSMSQELSKNDKGCELDKGVTGTRSAKDSGWTAYLSRKDEQGIGDRFGTHSRNSSLDANTDDAFDMTAYRDHQFEEDIHPDFK